MEIVVLDGYTLNPGDLSWDALAALGNLTVYDRTLPEQVVERAAKAEVVLTNKTVLDAEKLGELPLLKYIGVLATGYNVVDTDEARRRGMVVTNIPSYSTDSVTQMVFAHILNITQRVGHYAHDNQRGRWSSQVDFSYYDTPLVELAGKSIGIVGFGHIGQAVARVALAFGMKVLVYTSKSASQLLEGCVKMDMAELFAASDILTLHCPLTPDTKEIINADSLNSMKDGAILINTGRGGLVNEQALADALKSGKLAAAGLDVLVSEPPTASCPLVELDNCFITPHIAWATREARIRLMNQAVSNVKAYIDGNVINNVL